MASVDIYQMTTKDTNHKVAPVTIFDAVVNPLNKKTLDQEFEDMVGAVDESVAVDDADATLVTTALRKTEQVLTLAEKQQARTNINAADADALTELSETVSENKTETDAKLSELGSEAMASNYLLGLSVAIDNSINEGGVWNNKGIGESIMIPIREGDSIKITPTSGSYVQYALLTHVNGFEDWDKVSFVEGTKRETSYESVSIVAPSGVKYLYLLTKYEGVVKRFVELIINGNDVIQQKSRFIFAGDWNDIETALYSIPLHKRMGQCLLYYRVGVTSVYRFYYFVSGDIDNWMNTSLWKPIYTGEEVDSLLDGIKASMPIDYTNIVTSLSNSIGIGYSSYNNGELNSYTKLKEYPLSQIGDYIEVRFKTNGGDSYMDWLNLIEGTNSNSRCGVYDKTQFWLRQQNTYIKWTELPNLVNVWRTVKIQIVENGVELFVDGVSYGVNEYSETFIVGGLASNSLTIGGLNRQRFDIDYYTLKSGDSFVPKTMPVFVEGSANVQLKPFETEIIPSVDYHNLYMKKTANCIYLYKRLKDNLYIEYPLEYRYKDFAEGVYPSFYDNWGMGSPSLCTYDGKTMSVSGRLFYSAEAELAINVWAGNDSGMAYVGGSHHGFENISTVEGNRAIRIFIDSQNVEESALIDLMPINSVEVIQQSDLVRAYVNSNPFAVANKKWTFDSVNGLVIKTSVKLLSDITIEQAQLGMFGVYRRWLGNTNNEYLTNRAVKNNKPFITYNVEDGWEQVDSDRVLKVLDKDCTKISAYGQKNLGFALEIIESQTKENGGMFVTTNGNAYNKIYYDATGRYTAKEGEIIYATQKWIIE